MKWRPSHPSCRRDRIRLWCPHNSPYKWWQARKWLLLLILAKKRITISSNQKADRFSVRLTTSPKAKRRGVKLIWHDRDGRGEISIIAGYTCRSAKRRRFDRFGDGNLYITHYCVRILYLRRFFCVAKIYLYPLPFSIFDYSNFLFWISKSS